MNVDHIFSPARVPGLKRVLIAGANGQIGWELQRTAPENVDVVALDSSSLDIRDENQVYKLFRELSPEVVINAAAYTAVDKAEQEPELAYAVNATGAGYLAEACHNLSARFIHISTDFVFDGVQSKPYLPDDLPNPIGVYGASKLEGERLVTELTQGKALILRSAWVYSTHGHNFVKTMLRLLKEGDEIKVVVDQIGTPTCANGLAQAIWRTFELPQMQGLFHWTDAGVASWYDFAIAIQDIGIELGLIDHVAAIIPISSANYVASANRPQCSILNSDSTEDMVGVKREYWRLALRRMIIDLISRAGR